MRTQFFTTLRPARQYCLCLTLCLLAASRVTAMELAYDDGGQEGSRAVQPGISSAVRFTPLTYPVQITAVRFFIGSNPFRCYTHSVSIFDDDGPGGSPGSLLYGPREYDEQAIFRFVTHTLPEDSIVIVSEGDFYVAYTQVLDPFDCHAVARDTSNPDLRSWGNETGQWLPLGPEWGDVMIRAVVSEVPIPTLPVTWARIKALY